MARFRSLPLMLALLASNAALASMRCGTQLVEEGAPIGEVQGKCGAPQFQRNEYPAPRPPGARYYNPVQVTWWVYGPDNGAYRYLRFIDGKLVQIRLSRQAP